MKSSCPKCESSNTYQQDGQNACMMCGSRWPIVGTSSPILPAAPDQQEKTSVSKSKKKPCRNCGRVMTIPCHGLCGGCYGAVYGKYKKGTPEYDKALEDAKARLTDPNHSPYSRKRKKTEPLVVAAICTDNPEKAVEDIPVEHALLKDELTGVALIIDKLRAERDFYSSMIAKIDQAIEILRP